MEEYLEKYKEEQPKLCASCVEKKPCMFSHFDSKLIPVPVPEKIECHFWKRFYGHILGGCHIVEE